MIETGPAVTLTFVVYLLVVLAIGLGVRVIAGEMDRRTQRMSRCVIGDDYPPPVVDHVAAAKAARQQMGALRRGAARAEGQKILQRHGSRKGGLRVRP